MTRATSELRFQTDLHGIQHNQLEGFFEGWPNPPSAATLHQILERAAAFLLAVAPTGEVIGFINAISDGILTAYIPLLEVKAAWRGQGIASELLRRLKTELGELYMIDTACDDDLVPFYERFGMGRSNAMILRNYAAQSGKPANWAFKS